MLPLPVKGRRLALHVLGRWAIPPVAAEHNSSPALMDCLLHTLSIKSQNKSSQAKTEIQPSTSPGTAQKTNKNQKESGKTYKYVKIKQNAIREPSYQRGIKKEIRKHPSTNENRTQETKTHGSQHKQHWEGPWLQ